MSNINLANFVLFLLATSLVVSGQIEPELEAMLENGNPVSVVVSFKGGIQSVLQNPAFSSRQGFLNAEDRGNHIKSLIDALQENSDSSQESTLQILSLHSDQSDQFQYFKRYPSSNVIYIKEASPSIIKEIAEDPNVASIYEEPIIHLDKGEPFDRSEQLTKRQDYPDCEMYAESVTPGLELIQVPEAWEELGGSKGEGLIVAIIDTGVRHTHKALRDNFVGTEYGWFDALTGEPEPHDAGWTIGHGTHVMGKIAGQFGIGIVPGAKWMACLACDGERCPFEAVQDCFKFMECPTLPDGTNSDCSKAPRIINNSWVTSRNSDSYKEDIMRWRAMGIIPVFAIGNTGDACETTTSPGEYAEVIGVGSVSTTGVFHKISSVGPSAEGGTKPDLVAPGLGTFSAAQLYHENEDDDMDQDCIWWSGSSMAAPHVSGVVALLLVRNPDLTYEEAYKLLTENTSTELTVRPGTKTCDQPHDELPNNFFGYGLVNALKAVQAQTALLQK